MTTKDKEQPSAAPALDIDWLEVAKAALGSAVVAGLLGGALHVLGKMLDAETPEVSREDPPAAPPPNPTVFADEQTGLDAVDDQLLDAAMVLGVSADASEDEVRAALRARLADSQLHPDQGGDADEAKRFIAAKNLLVERIRAKRL